jgi:hypothetical protein
VNTLTEKPQRKTAREPWSDAGKEAAGTSEVKPTLEKNIAAPRAAVDATTGDQDITREKRAVWVVHGMGQQIPFETLDSLATGLLGALPNPTQVTPRLRTVKVGDQVLQRVELDINGVSEASVGKPVKKYELHLYETYWAPKTEGVARLKDVVSFLWDGGLRGILNSFKSFQRAMFGVMAPFAIRWLTPFWLCLTLLILVALTAINAVAIVTNRARND